MRFVLRQCRWSNILLQVLFPIPILASTRTALIHGGLSDGVPGLYQFAFQVVLACVF
jgi:hypothetical protein